MPVSKVTLSVAEDSLALLPVGAAYTARRGQAHVKVGRRQTGDGKPGHIIIEASCDSLEVQCARYEQRIETMQSRLTAAERALSTQKQKTKERQSWDIRTILYAFFAGVATGIVLILIIKKYGKKCIRWH